MSTTAEPKAKENLVDAYDEIFGVEGFLAKHNVERKEEIELVGLATISGVDMLLLGPPGVGKTYLLELLINHCLTDMKLFTHLLAKDMSADEVLGPRDIMAMKEGKIRRLTEGYLPDANYGYLDEALDVETPILMSDGSWIPIGHVAIGDRVFTADGRPTPVTAVTPVTSNHACYRLHFSDGSEMVADAGHKWMAQANHRKSPMRSYRTDELYTKLCSWQREDASFLLPDRLPLQYPKVADPPLDAYYMGLWLGNGNHHTGELAIRREFLDRTLALLTRHHPRVHVNKYSSPNCAIVSVAPSGVRRKLGDLGLLAERSSKRMPEPYLHASLANRLLLLQGLMDTDGSMMREGTCVFSNTNFSIIEGVAHLVRSLGATPSIKETTDERNGVSGPHKKCWKVTFRANPEYPPFLAREVAIPPIQRHRPLRIVAIEPVPSTEVRCITVKDPSHVFLAGTSLIPTGNCFKASPPLLNPMLDLLANRVLKMGPEIKRCKQLLAIFMSSNELPEREDLNAFRDRIAITKLVDPVKTPEGRMAVTDLQLAQQARAIDKTGLRPLDLRDLFHIRGEVNDVEVPRDIREKMNLAQQKWLEAGHPPSQRRVGHMWRMVKARAWSLGRSDVTADDLTVCQHMAWNHPDHAKSARDVILEFASAFTRKAQRAKESFEPVLHDLEELKKQAETAGDDKERDQILMDKGFILLRNLRGLRREISKQVTEGRRESQDVTMLDEVLTQVKAAEKWSTELLTGQDEIGDD